MRLHPEQRGVHTLTFSLRVHWAPATSDMKIHPRYANLAFSTAMSGVMSLVMTCAITAINTGFDDEYAVRWLQAWALAWPLAFASNYTIGPRLRQFIASRTAAPSAP